jgi:hypothetical protein
MPPGCRCTLRAHYARGTKRRRAANSFTECELNFLAAAAEAAQPFALVYLCILPTQTANNESRVLFAEAARRRVVLVQSAITQPPHNYNCTSSILAAAAEKRLGVRRVYLFAGARCFSFSLSLSAPGCIQTQTQRAARRLSACKATINNRPAMHSGMQIRRGRCFAPERAISCE